MRSSSLAVPAALLALALPLLSLGCGKPDLARVDGARISPRADGGAELVVDGWPQLSLSKDEVAGRATVEISYTRGADAVAFRTVDGKWANVVWLGNGTRRGPVSPAPLDYPTCLGTMIANEKDASAIVDQVRASKGKTGVAMVLGKAAGVEGLTWEARVKTLADDERAALSKVLEAAVLSPNEPALVVSRAVAIVDVASLPDEKLLDRISPIVTAKEPEGSLGASVLLRVLARKKADVGKLACKGLGSRAWKVEEPDPERRLLLDAMLMAIAHLEIDCAAVSTLVAEEPCASTLRCGSKGPVLPNETSDQTEPLCTAEPMKKALETELARPTKDVVADPHPGRTSFYAFAAHTLGKRPALNDLEKHHARRLYSITQPKGPECESLAETGKPCHAQEAMLRDYACRNEGETVTVGTLKLRISDEKKTISDVVTAPPP